MKKLTVILMMAAVILTAGKLQAQSLFGTNGVITTAALWASSVNTNYSYADLVAWDGPIYQNQLNIANELGASYDLWHSVNEPNNMDGTAFVAPEGRFRQAGIAGVLASGSGGLELGYMKGDLRVLGFADFVYFNNPTLLNAPDRYAYEIGGQVEKMLSPNTAAGVFVSFQEHQKYPIVGINLNVTFGTLGGLFSHL